jgi:2-polyprenyl-3-methyl-5-hydroxy-6-metoxy-1,4-benzoquinol methylase
MAIGASIRKAFGRHEHRVAELYRGIFVSLDDYREKILDLAPRATRILEVGCGEGAVTEILAGAYPDASILAIDITPRLGRLYRGRRKGVRFREVPVQGIATEQPGAFDLVTLSDVIHHIPAELRSEILRAVATCLAPGGRFVLKDWSRAATPIHWLCYAGDRFLTNDRIAYLTTAEALTLATASVPELRVVNHARLRPWTNNYAFAFQC